MSFLLKTLATTLVQLPIAGLDRSGRRGRADFAYVALGLRLRTVAQRDRRIPSWELLTGDGVRHPAVRTAIRAALDFMCLCTSRVKLTTRRRTTPTSCFHGSNSVEESQLYPDLFGCGHQKTQ